MVYKHAVVAAFRIYAQRGEDAAKRSRALIVMEITLLIMDKSWNCVFEFAFSMNKYAWKSLLPFL